MRCIKIFFLFLLFIIFLTGLTAAYQPASRDYFTVCEYSEIDDIDKYELRCYYLEEDEQGIKEREYQSIDFLSLDSVFEENGYYRFKGEVESSFFNLKIILEGLEEGVFEPVEKEGGLEEVLKNEFKDEWRESRRMKVLNIGIELFLVLLVVFPPLIFILYKFYFSNGKIPDYMYLIMTAWVLIIVFTSSQIYLNRFGTGSIWISEKVFQVMRFIGNYTSYILPT